MRSAALSMPSKHGVYAVRSAASNTPRSSREPLRVREDALPLTLFAEERQQAILDRLRQQSKVSVGELTGVFGVTSPTVRADLKRLELRGLLRRIRGGAMATGTTLYDPPFAERVGLQQREKQAIARQAVTLVREGETLLLDAGTTCQEIARSLKEFRRLTIVTGSLTAAQLLAENDALDVILIGGRVRAQQQAALGPLAVQFLDAVQCDQAFVTVNGVSAVAGLTAVDFDTAQLKRKMLQKARHSVLVADSSKVGQIAFATVGELRLADQLITDAGLTGEAKAELENSGLSVTVAG